MVVVTGNLQRHQNMISGFPERFRHPCSGLSGSPERFKHLCGRLSGWSGRDFTGCFAASGVFQGEWPMLIGFGMCGMV